ncbi:MAG: trigger factor [Candidatus Sulfobium sp.]
MTNAVEDISTTKKRLKIEIPTDVVEKEYRESVDRVRQKARIPGFRPGKAPTSLIEKKFGEDIKAEIIDKLVPRYYSDALKEAELVPVTMPDFETAVEVKRNEPLSFALTVEVRPSVPDFNYTGLKVEESVPEVAEEEIDDMIKGLQEERAMFEAVDREIREDDLLVIDYVKLDPSGEKELSSAKEQVMNLGNKLAPPAILEALTGRKKGDVVDISVPSFEKGEAKEEVPGDGSLLRITVKEVKEKKLPAIDDEFAKDFGSETIAAFRESVKERLVQAKKDKAAGEQKEKLLDSLVENYEFEVPDALLEHELEKLVVNEKYSRKKTEGQVAGGGAEKLPDEEEDSAIVERLRPKAVHSVKAGILLDIIAEKEGIKATEEEMKTRIGLLARHLQTTPDAVINLFVTRDGSLDTFRRTIRDEKVMDLVLSKAEKTKGA